MLYVKDIIKMTFTNCIANDVISLVIVSCFKMKVLYVNFAKEFKKRLCFVYYTSKNLPLSERLLSPLKKLKQIHTNEVII